MDRPFKLAGIWLVAAMAAGCGGRDPLLGEVDPAFSPPAAGVDAALARDAARDGQVPSIPPMVKPDASAVTPPAVRDAGMVTPTPNCVFPSCLMMLRASCAPSGACTQQRTGGGGTGMAVYNICYANNVKFLPMLSGSSNRPTLTTVVTRADGSTCYTREVDVRGAGVNAFSYKGPKGELIATATFDRTNLAITCAGQMTPQVVPTACEPGVVPGPPMCMMGACM